MNIEFEHEMVVCIVNAGFAQEVMAAAREAGAHGGTIIHSRGTADPEAEEFFNIAIQPDKDTVLIIVKTDIKDDVMKAVYAKIGKGTKGAGIAFSLPVTKTVGI